LIGKIAAKTIITGRNTLLKLIRLDLMSASSGFLHQGIRAFGKEKNALFLYLLT
jgi:hypothetical protein